MGLGECDDEKGTGLTYKETEMWMATIDLDEYLDNLWYIPRTIKEVTDRAWSLHDKYSVCRDQMDIAIKEKQKGNEALKSGKYEEALKHYGLSIRARTDYKASYNNRALACMKLEKYQLCIEHCNVVISMIKYVDIEEKKSDVAFKAYLRRANAHKFKENYEAARKDLDNAQRIKPNDGSVKKLLAETKVLHKRVKLKKVAIAIGKRCQFE